MADGNPEFMSYPLVWTTRHMPRGRKRAEVSSVVQTQVARLPSWSAHQAPLVAEVVNGQGTTAYRAARGADGVVRLVAPLQSRAFGRLDIDAVPRPDDHTDIKLFRYSKLTRNNGLHDYHDRPLPATSDRIGVIVSTDRRAALHYGAQLSASMVVVDGAVYAPCPEPGWHTYMDNNNGAYLMTGTIAVNAAQIEYGYGWNMHVPFCRNPAELVARHGIGGVWHNGDSSDIREHVAGALGGDADWAMMLALARNVHASAQGHAANLMEHELAALHALVVPKQAWTPDRIEGLGAHVASTARIVHSISTSGTSELLKAVQASVAGLAVNPAPAPLLDRLQRAGVMIPELPQGWNRAHNAEPAGLPAPRAF